MLGKRRGGKRKRKSTKSKGIRKRKKSHTTNVRNMRRDRKGGS
jgi:hypothetical protein